MILSWAVYIYGPLADCELKILLTKGLNRPSIRHQLPELLHLCMTICCWLCTLIQHRAQNTPKCISLHSWATHLIE